MRPDGNAVVFGGRVPAAYRDISDRLFGDDAAFSAHLPDRHIEGTELRVVPR